MAAVGQEQQLPDATNRQQRRRMEYGGAGMPVRTTQVSERPGSAGRKTGKSARRSASSSADVLDDLDELVEPVTLAAGEVDELLCSLDDGAAFGGASDGDAASAAELE